MFRGRHCVCVRACVLKSVWSVHVNPSEIYTDGEPHLLLPSAANLTRMDSWNFQVCFRLNSSPDSVVIFGLVTDKILFFPLYSELRCFCWAHYKNLNVVPLRSTQENCHFIPNFLESVWFNYIKCKDSLEFVWLLSVYSSCFILFYFILN